MDWTVSAPFFNEHKVSDSSWLAPFVPEKHVLQYIPRRDALANRNWHDRASAVTEPKEWLRIWHQSGEAFDATRGGVITVFPQLAATVGLRQRLSRKRVPVVAWCFNVTTCYPGLKGWLARFGLMEVNRFIVHTSYEREIYSRWLKLPLERFEFVPMQTAEIPLIYPEETIDPFVLAMGSNHRDYPTLFKAVKKLNLRTIVVSGRRALKGLDIPPQVETPFGVKKQDCLRLSQQARLNVLPMLPQGPAGIVTIIEAMRMSRAIIATRYSWAEDYIKDGETGLLVEPGSVADMARAIELLWHDHKERERLGIAAGKYAAQHFSDEVAGATLGKILDSVENEMYL